MKRKRRNSKSCNEEDRAINGTIDTKEGRQEDTGGGIGDAQDTQRERPAG